RVATQLTERVDEGRCGGRVQVDDPGPTGQERAELPGRQPHGLRVRRRVGEGERCVGVRAAVADDGELRRAGDDRVRAGAGRRAVAVPPGPGGLDRGERVQLAGALLGGGVAEVGRGAGEQLLDQGRAGAYAVVRLLVRLDDQRRGPGDERRGLA